MLIGECEVAWFWLLHAILLTIFVASLVLIGLAPCTRVCLAGGKFQGAAITRVVNHDPQTLSAYHSIGTSNILPQIISVATPRYSHYRESCETGRAADGKKYQQDQVGYFERVCITWKIPGLADT